MSDRFLDDQIITALSESLKLSSARQTLIGNNIANVETPGYKQKDVNFSGLLKSRLDKNINDISLATTDPRHISTSNSNKDMNLTSHMITSTSPGDKTGNNVNIDREMGNMAINTLYYESISEILSRRFKMMRSAVTGRGG